MPGTLPVWFVMAIVSMPCNSELEGIGESTTVAYQCSHAMVQGPKMPPLGWNKVDMTHKPEFKYPEKKIAKIVKKKSVKKKPPKKKRKR